ncbi:MAG: ATP-binding protein [Rhodospirillales bacterium]|nr:ATP-binding protein [Rhodospirillales bacterium]
MPPAMFRKRIRDLTAADIEAIVAGEVQEGLHVEFKRSLPAKGGNDDGWHSGASQIGEFARNRILEEVIAFANADGGTLVIGIGESGDKPARAATVNPIPRCAELAERLRQQCDTCVDPKIPVLECEGVRLHDDGSGVVVIRVPASRMAPHRHNATKECYTRRTDRSEPMGMREIQDLTLNIQRGLERIETRLSGRRAAFEEELSGMPLPAGHEITRSNRKAGVVFTLVPLAPLSVGRVYNEQSFLPSVKQFVAHFNTGGTVGLPAMPSGLYWKPILRGARAEIETGHGRYRMEVHSDGLIEFGAIWILNDGDAIFPGWVMTLAGNSLYAVEKFRRAAGAPEVEFAFDATSVASCAGIGVTGYDQSVPQDIIGSIPRGRTGFPRYSVRGIDELSDVFSAFETDFWNALGCHRDVKLTIDFRALFDR